MIVYVYLLFGSISNFDLLIPHHRENSKDNRHGRGVSPRQQFLVNIMRVELPCKTIQSSWTKCSGTEGVPLLPLRDPRGYRIHQARPGSHCHPPIAVWAGATNACMHLTVSSNCLLTRQPRTSAYRSSFLNAGTSLIIIPKCRNYQYAQINPARCTWWERACNSNILDILNNKMNKNK
jgi:hypothetical protein